MAPLAHFFMPRAARASLRAIIKMGGPKLGGPPVLSMPAEPARREAPIKTGSSPQATPELLIAHC